MNALLHCAVPNCGNLADTIWQGFALCEGCYEMAMEVPDAYTPVQMIHILMRGIEAMEEDETIDDVDAVHRIVEEIDLAD